GVPGGARRGAGHGVRDHRGARLDGVGDDRQPGARAPAPPGRGGADAAAERRDEDHAAGARDPREDRPRPRRPGPLTRVLDVRPTPLSPEQEAAVAVLDGPVRVVAGAGTGKTAVIAARFRRLLEAGVDPGN